MTFLKRTTKAGWQSFKRNGLVSSAAILILFITISSVTSVFLFNALSKKVVKTLQDKVSIGVYFYTNVPEPQILQFKEELNKYLNVKSIIYISREKALENFRAIRKDDDTVKRALEELSGQNPLPASLHIKADNPSNYKNLVGDIESSQFNSLIESVDYSDRQLAIANLNSLSKKVTQAGWFIVILFTIVAILVSFNTIRLAIYNEKSKIEVMRLVGANNAFINAPYTMQGILYGLIASIIAFFSFAIILRFIDPVLQGYFLGLGEDINLSNYYASNWFWFLLLQIVMGIVIGVVSSIVAVRKYIKM